MVSRLPLSLLGRLCERWRALEEIINNKNTRRAVFTYKRRYSKNTKPQTVCDISDDNGHELLTSHEEDQESHWNDKR